MPIDFEPLAIKDIVVVKPQLLRDGRGGFAELFKETAFAAAGIDATWRQINYSESKRHVLRGMHYQLPPHAQGKLVSVIRGRIFDAVVDIRVSSPTFGQSVSIELDADDKHMLWVPAGFAHGFCVLSEVAEVMYAVTAEYDRESERGIMWNDPALGITWPTAEPLLSDKDAHYPSLSEAETYS